jgi:SagB-type dehydrogenase family enzyme
METDESLREVIRYHDRTKHHPDRFARSLGYMDWATKPDPFRRYPEAQLLLLDETPPEPEPLYDLLFLPGAVPSRPVSRTSVSRLFYNALAISAWKVIPGDRWAVRVNPSSGNLHPTEGYLISGPVAGLLDHPALCHYAPREHGLEVRREIPGDVWREMTAHLPDNALLLGLTSIFWRESWKYGERAFRYCQHDVGHAVAALSLSAALLGWEARLLETLSDPDLALLLGVEGQKGPEAEHPDCLLVLFPRDSGGSAVPTQEMPAGPTPGRSLVLTPELVLSGPLRDSLRSLSLRGTPNRLSTDHQPWPVIDQAAEATWRPHPAPPSGGTGLMRTVPPNPETPPEEMGSESPGKSPPAVMRPPEAPPAGARPLSAGEIIRRRRSAVAMDGKSTLPRRAFYRLLERLMPRPGMPPYSSLPWRPTIDLVLFVQRVEDLSPGLYILIRRDLAVETLRASMASEFSWERPAECPNELPLYELAKSDVRAAAQLSSCTQAIASRGMFAVSMLADFDATLRAQGPWFYRHLHWEAGALGQVLYLEAESAGARGTGIGCFFDDLVPAWLKLKDHKYQVIYHFTVGGPVIDPRIQTEPSYAHRSQAK